MISLAATRPQPNITVAMAMVVAGDNTADPNVLVTVLLVGATLMMALLLPTAGELSKRKAGAKVTVTLVKVHR